VKGTKIPIAKRFSVKKPDGTVDVELLRSSTKSSMSKFDKGFEAFERNTGNSHPLAVGRTLNNRATGAVELTDDQGTLWYGSVKVGTPLVPYTVDFDTGSSDFFLPGKSCTANCEGHAIYDTSASSTSVDKDQTFSLKYGDGSTVEG